MLSFLKVRNFLTAVNSRLLLRRRPDLRVTPARPSPKLLAQRKGGRHAGDVGEGPGQAGGARALSEGDRGGCSRFRAGRAGLPALQCVAGRAGPECLLLLRSLPRRGRTGGASGGTPLRRLARGRGHARRAARSDALPDRVSGGSRVLDAK